MHGIGQKIVEKLTELAKKKNCYKIILDCKETNIPFYEKIGFQQKGSQMSKYF